MARLYRPLHVFRSSGSPPESRACLVVLNRDLSGLGKVLGRHWSRFSLAVCADGGANILFDSGLDVTPHTICGDLDSIRPAVLQHYQGRGCRVVQEADQDSTDFDKTVREVLAMRQRGVARFDSIYAANALGGRFDQTLGNVQTLMLLQSELEGTPLYLLSEDSIACLLPAGESELAVDSGMERGECGLVPIGEPCSRCSTSGLRWNLSGQTMKFGALVSTSNQLLPDRPPVHVTASSPLLWTMSHTLCS